MRYYSFEIVIEKEQEDPGYYAYVPALAGCFGNGATIEDARRSIREALRHHVEALQSRGEPVPQEERIVHVEEMSLAFV